MDRVGLIGKKSRLVHTAGVGKKKEKRVRTVRASTNGVKAFTYILSTCMNFMSIEWMAVNTVVEPWTTASRVSGIATGLQVARKTGSFLLHSGRYDR